jgi:hypothetical protein
MAYVTYLTLKFKCIQHVVSEMATQNTFNSQVDNGCFLNEYRLLNLKLAQVTS